jgi:hypothetical protein
MNKQSPEYIRVREEIAKKLYEQDGFIVEWYWKTSNYQEIYLKRADYILEIKGIAVLADDQKPPNNFVDTYDSAEMDGIRQGSYDRGQEDMLNAGFVKVVK